MDLTNMGNIVSTIELLGSIASIIGLVLTIIVYVSSNHKKSTEYSPSADNSPVAKKVRQEASFLPQTGDSLVPKDDDDARKKTSRLPQTDDLSVPRLPTSTTKMTAHLWK